MNTSVDIAICTFRRPHLAQTLASLAQIQRESHWEIRVIVADNDDTPSAKPLIEATAATFPFPIVYVHAPSRNISIARNACLAAANANWLAFLDDDELVCVNWLSALLSTAERTGACVVLGPVNAIYAESAATWLKQGAFHSTRPVWVQGEIITGYAGNALINRLSPALGGIVFPEAQGRSGGEDTIFFSRVHAGGGMIAFAEDAVATEPVTETRATLKWLLKRQFRAGQTHGLLLLSASNRAASLRLSQAAKACAKCAYCLVVSLLNLHDRVKWRRWLIRGALHAGVLSRLLGGREVTPYG